MSEPEDGIDIVKFFLGVMTLLTVFVAGFAVYNYMNAQTLAEEVDVLEAGYQKLRKSASDQAFLKRVAQYREMRPSSAETTDDFGLFLTQVAAEMELKVASQKALGATGQKLQGYKKESKEFTFDNQRLDKLMGYLWYVQAFRPGLKIETLNLKRAGRTREKTTADWTLSTQISTYRPEEPKKP